MKRREFARLAIVLPALVSVQKTTSAKVGVMAHSPSSPTVPTSLLTAPIELAGDWRGMIHDAAGLVVERMRRACLAGVRLLSDHQPTQLRVEERTSGPPAIWLHADGSHMAWIIVDIGERDWSKLAYQFGHELGHVLANSWSADAKPAPPCQWLEEALVEAFSLHGLGRLAQDWKLSPPFAGDNAFGDAIALYREDMIKRYTALAASQGFARDPAAWFQDHRAEIEIPAVNPFAQAMSVTILAEYDAAPDCIEALGALNRWPGRSGIPIQEYLQLWEESCAELHASSRLPLRLRELLELYPPAAK